ncbi:MAG: hypothetical protein ACRDLO_03400 [Solirubrobacterales bacterium]
MDARTLDWLDILGRGLLWGAVAVLGLSVIGAVAILTTDSVIGLFEDVQRQGRAILAVGAFGGGLTASGVLAGLGAIIRLEVAERRERSGR